MQVCKGQVTFEAEDDPNSPSFGLRLILRCLFVCLVVYVYADSCQYCEMRNLCNTVPRKQDQKLALMFVSKLCTQLAQEPVKRAQTRLNGTRNHCCQGLFGQQPKTTIILKFCLVKGSGCSGLSNSEQFGFCHARHRLEDCF